MNEVEPKLDQKSPECAPALGDSALNLAVVEVETDEFTDNDLPLGEGAPPNGQADSINDPRNALARELYSNYYGLLLRIAAQFERRGISAEDLAQDAISTAVCESGDVIKENMQAFLAAIVMNAGRSALRHLEVQERHRAVEMLYSNGYMPEQPDDEYRLMHDDLQAALSVLPDRQRQVIILAYFGDLSEASVAKAMDIGRGAVKSHKSRGMARLRDELMKKYPDIADW
jgi:RNA polymerase sigma factor (sigma-70 family)